MISALAANSSNSVGSKVYYSYTLLARLRECILLQLQFFLRNRKLRAEYVLLYIIIDDYKGAET